MTSMKFLAGAALALGLSSNANAAITVFTDQASYLAAISAPATDTFQNFVITGATPSPQTRAVGAYGYTAAVSGSSELFYGAGAAGDPWLSTNTAGDTIGFSNFTGDVFGVGGNFFGSNISGGFAAGDVTLTATDADGTVTRTILNASTASFLGFVSTSGITGMTLASVQGASPLWPTADNLILGGQVLSAVPEPATWAMMIIGFGAVGSMVRSARRRNAFSAV